MVESRRILAVIPARGGSKGLPGKNLRELAGLPLIAHSILLAASCTEVTDALVTTDAEEIADVARRFGARILIRPAELASDTTPMWPVVRHALEHADGDQGGRPDYVLLLDPTSPGRLPADVAAALRRLEAVPDADGVIGVSRPTFNPIWHCVVDRDGWMADLLPAGAGYTRRQDVPAVYRINASLYLWRAAFVRREPQSWREHGWHLMHEIPESRAIHIDDAEELAWADLLIRSGRLELPWLTRQPAASR